ncbi:MAG: sorbosone dehydrogenase family protein, partial [Nitrospiraceae bacterium]
MTNRLALLAAAGCLILTGVTCARAGSLPLEQIALPPGFSISLYADDVPNARGMVLGANGTLFVGSKKEGRLYAIVDNDGDHRADRIYTIARDLHMPVGVAFKDGALYVSSVDRILRFDAIEQHLADPPKPVVVTDRLTKETH